MTKDYDVLDGIKRNQSDALETAFDKGFQQGYEQGLSENLEKARKQEYDKGYSRGRVDAGKLIEKEKTKIYNKGIQDGKEFAWNLTKEICVGKYAYLIDPGMILNSSADEMAKVVETIKEFNINKKADDIEIGDEVIANSRKMVVVERQTLEGIGKTRFHCTDFKGSTYAYAEDIICTGKHYDDVQKIIKDLQEVKVDENT